MFPRVIPIAAGVLGGVLAFGTCRAECVNTQLFDVQAAAADPGVTQVLTGRLDADTLADLVVVRGAAGTVEIRLHIAGTEFTTVSTLTWTSPIRRALLADVDRDGVLDLVFTDDASRVVIERGVGDGTMVLAKTLTLPYPVFDLAAADFGNGGALEIVVSHPSSGRVTTLVSTSGLAYSSVTTDISSYVPDPRYLVLGRFDADLRWDVIVTGASTRMFLLRGAGSGAIGSGAFTVGSSLVAAGVPSSLEAKDLDGDGKTDLIFGSSARVEWVYGTGSSVSSPFDPGGSQAVAAGPVSDLLVADANDDRNADLVCTSPSSSVVTAIVGAGGRTWGASTQYTIDGQPASLALSDLGGSVGPDLIVGGGSGMTFLLSHCDPPVDPRPAPVPPPYTLPADPTEGPIPPLATVVPPPPPQDPGPIPAVEAWPENGVTICDAPGTQSGLVGADDFAHGAYFAWIDGRNGEPDVYAIRLGPDGQRVAGWPANGLPVCTAAGVQNSVSCVTDGKWGVWILWLDDRSGSAALYAQKLTADGQVATGWPANGRQVCTASTPGPIYSYSAWPDLFGGLRLGWKGPPSRLYAQHLDAQGQPAVTWPPCGTTGVVDTTSTDPECGPLVSSITNFDFAWPDGLLDSRSSEVFTSCIGEIPCFCQTSLTTRVSRILGGTSGELTSTDGSALAAYDEAGGYYVKGQGFITRIGAFGHPSWGVATTAYRALPTPSGQFFLLEPWAPFDVRRLDDDGTTSAGFAAGEQPLCNPPCEPAAIPSMVEDGSGGVFLVWPDSRGDLFVTWYDDSGTRGAGWTSDGDHVTNLDTSQELGPLVGDHRGSVIVGWRDQRNGEWDLYARRFTAEPIVAARPHGSTLPEGTMRTTAGPRLLFLGPRPNPSATGLAVAFSLSRAGDVRLRVLDVAGREAERRDLRTLAPGAHVVDLDEAHALAPGIYLVEFAAEGRVFHAKVVLTR